MVHRIILDEAALFLSDKSNAVSVNLARGKLTSVMILKKLLEIFKCSFDQCLLLAFVTDYVQVVDMGTLELRITAVKPGLDGKLVSQSVSN